MDPQGPSQPPLDTAYETKGNPTDHTAAEQRTAQANAQSNDGLLVDARERGDVAVPSSHNEGATASSLGYGVRDSSKDKTGGAWGEPTTEAEQMRAPGEGEIASAQDTKTGFGEQEDLASDLDRKKAEQSERREAVKEQRQENIDVGGALGQRTGPSVVEGR